MDLNEKEEDLEINLNDEDKEEPLLASPPPLPFKGPLSTYEVGEPSSVASASVFSARHELNQLRQDFGILGSRVQYLTRGMGTCRTEIGEAHKEAIRARRRLDMFIWEMSFVIELDIPELIMIQQPRETD
nr:hypothetical protein [Tanacetum cinerariifolium]